MVPKSTHGTERVNVTLDNQVANQAPSQSWLHNRLIPLHFNINLLINLSWEHCFQNNMEN